MTINCPLIFSLFSPLIEIWLQKLLNGKINGTNNGVNKGNFEQPYWAVGLQKNGLDYLLREGEYRKGDVSDYRGYAHVDRRENDHVPWCAAVRRGLTLALESALLTT